MKKRPTMDKAVNVKLARSGSNLMKLWKDIKLKRVTSQPLKSQNNSHSHVRIWTRKSLIRNNSPDPRKLSPSPKTIDARIALDPKNPSPFSNHNIGRSNLRITRGRTIGRKSRKMLQRNKITIKVTIRTTIRRNATKSNAISAGSISVTKSKWTTTKKPRSIRSRWIKLQSTTRSIETIRRSNRSSKSQRMSVIQKCPSRTSKEMETQSKSKKTLLNAVLAHELSTVSLECRRMHSQSTVRTMNIRLNIRNQKNRRRRLRIQKLARRRSRCKYIDLKKLRKRRK